MLWHRLRFESKANILFYLIVGSPHLLVAAAACELATEEDCKEGDEEDEAEGDGNDEEEQAGVLLRLLQQSLVQAGGGARLAGQDQPGLLVSLLAAELARPGGVPTH